MAPIKRGWLTALVRTLACVTMLGLFYGCLPDPDPSPSGSTSSTNSETGGEEDGEDGGSGGTTDDEGNLCWPEEASPGTEDWLTLSPMTQARSGHAVAVLDCSVYVLGGTAEGAHLDSVERYDALDNEWQTLSPLPQTRYGATAQAVNGILYVFGGEQQNEESYELADTVLEYDPSLDVWRNCDGGCADLPEARYLATSAAVDDLVLLMGGVNGSYSALDTVTAYDVYLDEWVDCAVGSCASMPAALEMPAAAVVDGQVYLAGGGATGNTFSSSAARFDADANQWSSIAGLSAARGALQAAGTTDGERFLVVGGRINGGVESSSFSARIDAYHPTLGTWERLEDLSLPRAHHAAVWLDGALMVLGGAIADDDNDDSSEVTALVEARLLE